MDSSGVEVRVAANRKTAVSSPYLAAVIAHVAYLVLALGFFAFGRAPSPRAPAAATHQPVAEAVPEPEGS